MFGPCFVFRILCLSSFVILVCGGSVFCPCFGIQYFLQSHCLWGLCVWPLCWYLVLYVVLACNHFGGKERAGCLTLTVFLMYCDC